MNPVPALLVVQETGRVAAVAASAAAATAQPIVQEVVRRAGNDLAVVLFRKLRQHVLAEVKLRLDGAQIEALALELGLAGGRDRFAARRGGAAARDQVAERRRAADGRATVLPLAGRPIVAEV